MEHWEHGVLVGLGCSFLVPPLIFSVLFISHYRPSQINCCAGLDQVDIKFCPIQKELKSELPFKWLKSVVLFYVHLNFQDGRMDNEKIPLRTAWKTDTEKYQVDICPIQTKLKFEWPLEMIKICCLILCTFELPKVAECTLKSSPCGQLGLGKLIQKK